MYIRPTAIIEQAGCMIVFLDIDGVLRSTFLGHNCSGYCQIDRFETVMRDFLGWEIVISAGLREKKDLNALREMFSADIADRIIGVTPVIGLSIKHCRQREIERYLANTNQTSAPWVVLDDVASQFEDGMDNLVLCHISTGLDEHTAERLRAKLTMFVQSLPPDIQHMSA